MGSDESHVNISLIVRDKVTRHHKPQPFRRERKAEAESSRGPSAYQPKALPLCQTGSQGPEPWTYIRHGNCPRKRKNQRHWNWLSAEERQIYSRGKEIGGTKNKNTTKQTKTPGSTDFSSENLRNNQSAPSPAAIACFSREHSHVQLLLLRAGLNAVILHVFTPCFGWEKVLKLEDSPCRSLEL